MKFALAVACALLLFAGSVPARAQQHDHAAAGADVGSDSVSFLTSCAPALRQDFNRAVALLHSFWFAQAIAAFDGVSAKDPSCGITHWGVALSRWGNPFAGLRSPQESIETNRRSAEAALKENATAEALHAMDYQTYAYLQIAKDTEARRVAGEASVRHGPEVLLPPQPISSSSLSRSLRRRAGRGSSRPTPACDRSLQTAVTGSQ